MRRLAGLLAFAGLGTCLVGCPGPARPPTFTDAGGDGGGRDAGASDGSVDASDAGTQDAGPLADVGLDGGSLDDTGVGDAGELDGGGSDAGGLDAGAGSDAGRDAGPSCGNGHIEGSEACDTADFGGATCQTLGFVSGALACSSGCVVDVSACSTCGDGVRQSSDACDMLDLGGATCVSRGFASGALACSGACAFDESGCVALPQPGAGDVVIAEVMPDPTAIGDADGEWFEVLNRSTQTVTLRGCTVEDNQTTPATFTIDRPVVLAPGALATFARSAMAAFTPSFVYPGTWALANTGTDAIRIRCGGTLVDGVDYTPAFPWSAGVAMSLDPARAAAGTNDAASDWCAATATFGGGATPDRGTPGTANPACFAAENCSNGMDDDRDSAIDCADSDCAADPACATYAVGFCRLQFPLSISGPARTLTTVYGRVYAAGLTDRTSHTDPATRLLAAVGYGPDGSDPATATDWVWTAATPNAGYDGGVAGEPDNDEYQASLLGPGVAGSYDYAYRFSGDGGTTWVYCDGQAAGSSDGYHAADAGDLVTTTSLPGALFFSEYVEGSSNNKALEIVSTFSTPTDLTGCSLRLYSNGSMTPVTLALTQTIAPRDVLVVCHSGAGAALTAQCDVPWGQLTFNGDDAIELYCGAATVDVIGQIGTDPGTAWGMGSTSTLDHTLRRACIVSAGDALGTDAFDPATQWVGYAVDTFTGLGSWGCPP